MQSMLRVFIFLLLSFLINISYANDMQQMMDQVILEQQSLKDNSYDHLKNFCPSNMFDRYSSNPIETQYYNDTDAGKLKDDAIRAKSSSETGNNVNNSIHNHPSFVITQNDSDINHSQLIQDNAENIINGITNRYVDCKSPQICKTIFQNKTCEEIPQCILQVCTKTLNIDVIPHEATSHYTLVVHLKTSSHNYAAVSVNAVTGRIGFIGPRDTSFQLEGRIPSSVDGHGLQGSITQMNDHNRGTRIDSIAFPTANNGMILDFQLSSDTAINLDMKVDIISRVITNDIKDRWVENCDGLLHEPSCQFKSKICSEPKESRTFQGVSVTRDCWQETYQYICHGGSGNGDCKGLQSQGCEQINSICIGKNNDECIRYQQTYQCPIQSCSPSSNIVCGDGTNYCLDGNCVDHGYQGSKDFAKGVSALSAISDASKKLDPSTLTIFAGHPVECSEKPVGFSNCCSETGWGQDIGLASCPLDAKKLHEAREQGQAVKVGRYCSGSDPFPCLEHSQVYCVFNSKLAKIVQEQGRGGQLQIDFGTAKSPNCQGITPEQLQSLDLSKIDFKDFYADIHAKTPDLSLIQQKITQQVQQFQEAGTING